MWSEKVMSISRPWVCHQKTELGSIKFSSQFISHFSVQFSGVQFSSHNVQFLLLISVLTSLFSSVQFSLLVLSSVQFTSSCQFSAVYSSVLTPLSSYFSVQFIGVYNSLLIRSHHSQFSYSVISPQHWLVKLEVNT